MLRPPNPARSVIPDSSERYGDLIASTSEDAETQSVIIESGAADDRQQFAQSVARGLTDVPPWLHCKYLYDELGSSLFDEICDQPEYYQTRTESGILARHSSAIAAETGPVTLIELGSGSSAKTDHLLEAYAAAAGSVLYVPVDVSEAALEAASAAIVSRHPNVTVTGLVGPYEVAFPLFRRFSPVMVLFLGSTIGNFEQQDADAFWDAVSNALAPGDYFLLGVDLIKDEAQLNAAYNDAAGVTAAFTRNLFARINRELGAAIDVDQIEHVASYNPQWQRVEIYARFLSAQDVYLEPLGRTVSVDAGTLVMTEISRKYDPARLPDHLSFFGFATQRVFTDENGWFAELLLKRE